MKRTLLIIVLVIGLIAAGVFAFFQTRSLQALVMESTEAIAELEASSTQSASDAIASSTALSNSAYATYTQAADDYNNAVATSTEIAQEFNLVLAIGSEEAAEATEFAESSFATGTALAESADATSTAFFDSSSTQAANYERESNLGTESANLISTQSANATAASDSQATLAAQNLSISGTLEASGWVGSGLFGASASLPEGFDLFEASDFELAMPESFNGADIRSNPRSFFALLDALGLTEASAYLRSQDDNFIFFAIDGELVNDVPRATVSLVRDTPSIAISLNDYLGGAYQAIQGNAALIISDILPVNGEAVGRSIVEQTFSEGNVRQLQYVFQVEGSFYILTFTSPISEFATMRPTFEQIAMTLRLKN